MSAAPQRPNLLTTIVIAVLVLLASACGTSTAPVTLDDAIEANDAAGSSTSADSAAGTAADDGASTAAGQASDDVEEALQDLEDLSDEETELLLEAFDDAFNAEAAAIGATDTAEEQDPFTVPEGGGAPDVTGLPYGLCDFGWVVFDTLTWVDALAMLDIDSSDYTGAVADDSYEYVNSYYQDAGAAMIDSNLWCGSGDFGTGEADFTIAMKPFEHRTRQDNFDPSWIEGEVREMTTQAGQPMVVQLEGSDGTVDVAEVVLPYSWSGSPDGEAQLTITFSNFYTGVTDRQVEGLVAIAELISTSAQFAPPAFESPLPGWYACEGRNFVHADAAAIADALGIEDRVTVLQDVASDWESSECVLATVADDGDIRLARGDFAIQAQAYPANSEDYERDLASLEEDPSMAQGTMLVAGRDMRTFRSEQGAVVILDDGAAQVAIQVVATSPGNADANLAKLTEIVQIITG